MSTNCNNKYQRNVNTKNLQKAQNHLWKPKYAKLGLSKKQYPRTKTQSSKHSHLYCLPRRKPAIILEPFVSFRLIIGYIPLQNNKIHFRIYPTTIKNINHLFGHIRNLRLKKKAHWSASTSSLFINLPKTSLLWIKYFPQTPDCKRKATFIITELLAASVNITNF